MDTLKTLRDEVLRHLDEYGDTGTTKSNVDNAINQAHFQRLTEQPWPFMLWRKPVTFTLTNATQTYSLHQAFHRPYYFRNTTTRQNLVEVPMRELSATGLDWNNDTSGRHFALWGRSPVQTQPAASSQLTIVSTSASDSTAAKGITVQGETANGVESETIVPNGTSNATSAKSFTHILAVTKGAAWAGTLTMTSDSGATTNLVLGADEWGRSYQQFYLLYVPGAGDVIEYRFYRTPIVLSTDNDVPEIPYPHSRLLVWDALMILAAYNGQIDPSRAQIWGDNQSRMVQAFQQAHLDGQSIEASTRLVRYIDN